MYTSKETETKTPFERAREKLIPIAYEKLVSLGYGEDKSVKLVPKNFQTNKFEHLLLKHYEFNGDCYFVVTNSTWDHVVDINGNFVSSIVKAEAKDINLYKLPRCENFDDVYAFTDFGGTKTKLTGSYKIPISEFILVKSLKIPETATKVAPTLFDSLEEEQDDKDENINTLTIKDLYAIMQNVPVSNKEWLNNVIKKTNVIRTKED